jgi:hypothetical protein
MSSTTKISNSAIHFYCEYYAHLFVRESLLCDVTIYSSHVGRQLMNMKMLEQISHGCIVAIDSAIHDTPEIAPSCNQKLDEVIY